MNKILLIALSMILSACTVVRGNDPMNRSIISPDTDFSLISDKEATIIAYHHQGHDDTFIVFVDKTQNMGVSTASTPLKFSITPGTHSIHASGYSAIDRITQLNFEAGKIYYMRIWIDQGMWVSSIRVTQTASTDL